MITNVRTDINGNFYLGNTIESSTSVVLKRVISVEEQNVFSGIYKPKNGDIYIVVALSADIDYNEITTMYRVTDQPTTSGNRLVEKISPVDVVNVLGDISKICGIRAEARYIFDHMYLFTDE